VIRERGRCSLSGLVVPGHARRRPTKAYWPPRPLGKLSVQRSKLGFQLHRLSDPLGRPNGQPSWGTVKGKPSGPSSCALFQRCCKVAGEIPRTRRGGLQPACRSCRIPDSPRYKPGDTSDYGDVLPRSILLGRRGKPGWCAAGPIRCSGICHIGSFTIPGS
jgi:hypothetical protein